MGGLRELLAKNVATLNVPELITAVGEYSYVLKAKDVPALPDAEMRVAHFELGKGSWVVFAKSTMRAPGGEGFCDVQWRLSATEGASVQSDLAKASGESLQYSSVALLLGARLATAGTVELTVTQQGTIRGASLLGTVIAAIQIDKLFVWDL